MDDDPGTLAGTAEAGSKGRDVSTEGNDGRRAGTGGRWVICVQGLFSNCIPVLACVHTGKGNLRQSPDYKY